MNLPRTIAVAFMIALLAVSVRADQGPGGGGPGSSSGGSGSSGGSDDGNGNGPPVRGATKGPPGGPSGHEKRQAASQDGSYTLTVSGFFKGAGTATVNTTSVSLTATVKSEGGDSVQLSASGLTLSGPYFTGTGTIGDAKVEFKGRVDADKGSRLIATYKTLTDNHRGRVAGVFSGPATTAQQ